MVEVSVIENYSADYIPYWSHISTTYNCRYVVTLRHNSFWIPCHSLYGFGTLRNEYLERL